MDEVIYEVVVNVSHEGPDPDPKDIGDAVMNGLGGDFPGMTVRVGRTR